MAQDFITYLPETSSQSVREGVQGQGSLHGSAILNNYFRTYFQTRYRALIPDFLHDLRETNDSDGEENLLNHVVSEFENQKRKFSNSRLCTEMVINIPGIKAQPRYKVENGWIRISREDIENLFAKITGPIIKSIEQQISSFNNRHGLEGYRIEHFIFVGGLSRNAHVLSSLKSHFDDVEIITPQPETATLISKGAILLALHPDWVGERVLRCSLGFVQDEVFNPAVHTEPEDRNLHDGDKVKYDFHDRICTVQERINWLFEAVGDIFARQNSHSMTDNVIRDNLLHPGLAIPSTDGSEQTVQEMYTSQKSFTAPKPTQQAVFHCVVYLVS